MSEDRESGGTKARGFAVSCGVLRGSRRADCCVGARAGEGWGVVVLWLDTRDINVVGSTL